MFWICLKQQEEESEKWCIKSMLQTSTGHLLLDMLAMKSNNKDPLALLVIPTLLAHSLSTHLCTHLATQKPL